MKKMKIDKKILLELIDKYQEGNANSEEIELLVKFFYSQQKEQKWPNEIPNKKLLLDKIFKNIKTSISKEPVKKVKIKRVSLRKFFKYAALIAVLLIASNLLYKKTFTNELVTKKAVEKIKSGYEKATLILEDGTTVDLKSNDNTVIASTNITQIKNENNILKYNTLTKETTTNNKEEITLEETLVYNTLVVPIGGMYQVELPDGTRVWINSASSLKYPVKFSGENRTVELTGEAYFEVTKDSKEFIVETNSASISVLGTKFNVSSYNNDAYFSSTLVEGKIKLTTKLNTEKSVILSPGERGKINNGTSTITTKKVDPQVFTAWKEGKFYFEKENLDRILTKIGRWYDIDIVFDDPSIKKETFTGVVLKNKPIDYLLNMISETANLKYNLKKNTVDEKYKLIISKN